MQVAERRWERAVLGVLGPMVMVALVLVPLLVVGGALPDPLATRFGLDGRARTSTSLPFAMAFQAALSVVPAAVLVRIAWRPGPDAGPQAATAGFVGYLSGALWVLVLAANDGVEAWRTATIDNVTVAAALCGALACSLVLLLVARRVAPAHHDDRVRGVGYDAEVRAAWFGRARSTAFLVAGLVFVVLGVVVTLVGQHWAGIVTVCTGLLLLGFASVSVAIGEHGIEVRPGLVGWPRVRLPLHRIESVNAIDVRPGRWGGWGYRGSVRLFRRAAWLLRAGPGLELELRGGRGRFTVTVDGADAAAEVLTGLLGRPTNGDGGP